jgi:hypothetical protein
MPISNAQRLKPMKFIMSAELSSFDVIRLSNRLLIGLETNEKKW